MKTRKQKSISFGCRILPFPPEEIEFWFDSVWDSSTCKRFEKRAREYIKSLDWPAHLSIEFPDIPREVHTDTVWNNVFEMYIRLGKFIRKEKKLIPYSVHSSCFKQHEGFDKTFNMQLKRVKQTSAFGGKILVVHLSEEPELVHNAFEPYKSIEFDTRVLKKLLPYLRQYKIEIAIENTIAYPLMYMFEVMSGIKSKYIGYCLDTGHLAIQEMNFSLVIEAFSSKLIHTHLQDVVGWADNHWDIGKGVVPWNEIVRSLFRIDYKGCWLFEVLSYDPISNINYLTGIINEQIHAG